MTVTLDLPDDIARMLGSPEDVSRRALESFGLEEFRAAGSPDQSCVPVPFTA